MCKFIDLSEVEQLQKALEPSKSVMGPGSEMAMISERQAAVWNEINRAFADGIRSAEKVLEKAEVLGKFGWALPMHASPRELVWLVERSIDLESANQVFREYYTACGASRYRCLMTELVGDEALEKWRGYLQEIGQAYDQGLYRVCVPALFATLDGIAYYNWTTKFYKSHGRQQFFKSKMNGLDSFDACIWQSVAAFVKIVFKEATPTNSEPMIVNRHWILHGRGIPDGTQTDCLRLLQAIHTFAFLAGAASE